ncbi:AMP-binding protein [Sulfuritalea sp.]|uniref:AMP-binding protein n=1 Tax=Sulfuritalea sp. TaxID=2480090 RepID=UPI001AC3C23A|nr:AMP-binding protein [Sulfuritalea sp.]MBN8474340.1 AMP-binding protein [Sulfuritalea sp.]
MTAALVCGALQRTGAETDANAARLAGGLVRLGIEDGDVVAVMLRNVPAFVDIIQGCRLAGAYYCQINWHFKSDEAGFILADCGAKVLFIQPDLLAGISSAVPASVQVIVIDAGAGRNDHFDAWLAVQSPCCGPPRTPRGHMAYTSGTTGRPKGVRRLPLSPEQQALSAQVAKEALGIYPGVRSLLSAPLYHSAPSSFAQQSLLQGELFVLEEKFDAEATLALIERHRIDTVYLVPVMYVRLLRLPPDVRSRYDLSSLKFVASTGSPCAPEVKKAMIEWLGPVIHEAYASSETGYITVMKPQDAARKPGSAGRAVGQAKIRILDDAGRELPTGEIGTIYAHQPAYSDFTYHGNEAARRAIECDGLASVGDMGYVDDEGFLYVCDRASDMVISGGVNIYPAEIEHVLITLPGIADCAVVGIPDEEFGEALAAQVVAETGAALDADSIRRELGLRIAGYKVPRRIDIVAALPRDDNGKVQKRRIRDAYWSGKARRI